MKDIGIKRICVSVSELEKSLAFFTGEMELTEVCRGRLDEQTVAAVYGLGSSAAEYAMLKNEEQPTLLQLICFTNTPKRPIREGRPSWDFGYYDVAFRAKDNSWAYEHFRDLGFDYYCPPTRYVAYWINLDVLEGVLKGPDAMPMALIERLKEPIPRFEGMFSIFTDVAQTVASGEEAARFYEGVLGLSKVFDEELPDGLVDDIVGVPHGTHTRMLMFAGGNTPITECLEYSIKGRPMSDVAKPENVGVFATAYETGDLDALLERCAAAGFETAVPPLRLRLEPYGEIRLARVNGPSGMSVELFQAL